MKNTKSPRRSQQPTSGLRPRTPVEYDSSVDAHDDLGYDEDQDCPASFSPKGASDLPADLAPESAAWAEHAHRLAKWTMANLVNRKDLWTRYLSKDERTAKRKLVTVKKRLTRGTLARHFRGMSQGDLVALPTISKKNQSRSMTIEIDLHGDADPAQEDANRKAAVRYYNQLVEMGFTPLLEASNGQGGYHLVTLFEEPLSSRQARGFGRWMVRDWEKDGLAREPEIFPKQDRLTPKAPCGSVLRLPGRHHTLSYFSEVWNGKRWVSGESAIKVILKTRGKSVTRIPLDALTFLDTLEARREAGGERDSGRDDPSVTPGKGRPIDRVLARLEKVSPCGDGWSACCPAHHDDKPSMTVGVGNDGKVLVDCKIGCGFDKIVAALEMDPGDFFADKQPKKKRSKPEPDPEPEPDKPELIERMTRLAAKYEKALTPERMRELAGQLHLPEKALKALGVGWRAAGDKSSWTFPERNGSGQIIGISLRKVDGEKRFVYGSKRGLIVPDGWEKREGPLLVPEGASDTAALHAMGLAAVGRFSSNGGAQHLAELLRECKRDVIVLGEFDPKPDGTWPGLAGAQTVAAQLAERLGRKVLWAMPPKKAKDVREWMMNQGGKQP